jgi:hypothetical protein
MTRADSSPSTHLHLRHARNPGYSMTCGVTILTRLTGTVAHALWRPMTQSAAPMKPYMAAFVSAGRAALRSSTVRVAHTSRNTRYAIAVLSR